MILGIANLIAALFAGPLPPACLYPFIVPSLAWVRADPDGVGTAWVVDAKQRLLITCRHVVGESKRVEVFFPHTQDGALVTERSAYLGERESLRKSGKLVIGKVTRTSDQWDLALIEVEKLPSTARALSLHTRTPTPGEPVCMVGNRFDLETLWNITVGPVRQSGALTDGYFWQGQKLGMNAQATVLQMPIAEGDSGAPVFDRQGRVLAVLAANRFRAAPAAVGITAKDVQAFLKREPTEIPTRTNTPSVYSRVVPATVWIRPTATDSRLSGVLIDGDRRWILTTATGVGASQRVGVTFPLPGKDGHWIGERDSYRDPVSLHLSGAWRIGTVIGRDPRRDLALVQLDSLPAGARAVPWAVGVPEPGQTIHLISHPLGVEFVWMYSSGSIRQRGRTSFGLRSEDPLPEVLVLQVPVSPHSSGGPLINGQGQLISVLSSKVGSEPQVGYAVAPGEIQSFLADQVVRDLVRKLQDLTRFSDLARFAAQLWVMEAEKFLKAGEPVKARAACDKALSLVPDDNKALLVRARVAHREERIDEALADLDRAIVAESLYAPAIHLRATLWTRRGEAKQAAGDLQRLLDVNPADLETRRRLATVFVSAGEDEKSAAEFANVIRLDEQQLRKLAEDIQAVAEDLNRRNPTQPGRTAEYLTRVLAAMRDVLPRGVNRTALDHGLAKATSTQNPAERLTHLRSLCESLR